MGRISAFDCDPPSARIHHGARTDRRLVQRRRRFHDPGDFRDRHFLSPAALTSRDARPQEPEGPVRAGGRAGADLAAHPQPHLLDRHPDPGADRPAGLLLAAWFDRTLAGEDCRQGGHAAGAAEPAGLASGPVAASSQPSVEGKA